MGAVSVLAVSPAEDDYVLLEHVFSHSNWKLDRARTCGEAVDRCKHSGISVIISATQLPDGTWKDLLQAFRNETLAPRLIVVSRLADEGLWAEVLDLGGYDVLGKPIDPSEVVRVVSLAWRQWKHEADRLAQSTGA